MLPGNFAEVYPGHHRKWCNSANDYLSCSRNSKLYQRRTWYEYYWIQWPQAITAVVV